MFINSGPGTRSDTITFMCSGGTCCNLKMSQKVSRVHYSCHISYSHISQDALTWTITDPTVVGYRIRFENVHASDKFAVLASCWKDSKGSEGGKYDGLRRVVLEIAANEWDDEEIAFEEIDMLTSTFALFDDNP